uniref:Olfactory receptor n=1 Tax=Sphenodon punctatus TaxID=8508 RepID=A0A8D0HG60_SPHPU
ATPVLFSAEIICQVESRAQMSGKNYTRVTKFILVGFSNLPELQGLFLIMFLAFYLITLTGNLLIILVTLAEPALHTPMYFFLRNLSFLEISYTSVTLPKMLTDKAISFAGCAAQMCFILFLGGTECFLLGAMAYDRYVAICNPLHYTHILNSTRYIGMAAVSWLSGLLMGLGHTSVIFTLPFCDSNEINHFFCDIPPVLKLACGDTHLNEIAVFAVTMLFLPFPFILILASYFLILNMVLKMPSPEGRRKAFSTCSSHLVVLTLFYGSASVMYLRPKSAYSSDMEKFISLFYTIITPMLNPIIYSLRNREVKQALRRTIARKGFLKRRK